MSNETKIESLTKIREWDKIYFDTTIIYFDLYGMLAPFHIYDEHYVYLYSST